MALCLSVGSTDCKPCAKGPVFLTATVPCPLWALAGLEAQDSCYGGMSWHGLKGHLAQGRLHTAQQGPPQRTVVMAGSPSPSLGSASQSAASGQMIVLDAPGGLQARGSHPAQVPGSKLQEARADCRLGHRNRPLVVDAPRPWTVLGQLPVEHALPTTHPGRPCVLGCDSPFRPSL